jgi:hypothetical protein
MTDDLILVLPAGASSSVEAQTFGGVFPGVWTPGVPQPVAAVGLTAAQARRLIALHGLPLVESPAPAVRPERPARKKPDPEAD